MVKKKHIGHIFLNKNYDTLKSRIIRFRSEKWYRNNNNWKRAVVFGSFFVYIPFQNDFLVIVSHFHNMKTI